MNFDLGNCCGPNAGHFAMQHVPMRCADGRIFKPFEPPDRPDLETIDQVDLSRGGSEDHPTVRKLREARASWDKVRDAHTICVCQNCHALIMVPSDRILNLFADSEPEAM